MKAPMSDRELSVSAKAIIAINGTTTIAADTGTTVSCRVRTKRQHKTGQDGATRVGLDSQEMGGKT